MPSYFIRKPLCSAVLWFVTRFFYSCGRRPCFLKAAIKANSCIKVDGTKGHTKSDVVFCAKNYIKGHLKGHPKGEANYTLHFPIIILVISATYFLSKGTSINDVRF